MTLAEKHFTLERIQAAILELQKARQNLFALPGTHPDRELLKGAEDVLKDISEAIHKRHPFYPESIIDLKS